MVTPTSKLSPWPTLGSLKTMPRSVSYMHMHACIMYVHVRILYNIHNMYVYMYV